MEDKIISISIIEDIKQEIEEEKTYYPKASFINMGLDTAIDIINKYIKVQNNDTTN